jgi:hypothetical protein
MSAPKGNRYGIDSGNFFKPKKYTPVTWKNVFIKYLNDRQNKAWSKNEPIKSGEKAGELMKVPTQLPLTIESFCVFAGVSKQTFYNYEGAVGYEKYFDITTRIREVIESDQFDGATVGAYNPNIIARKLGLAEKTKSEVEVTTVMTDQERNERIAFLREKLKE